MSNYPNGFPDADEDGRPEPPGLETCARCRHPWRAHNLPDRLAPLAEGGGCDAWANPIAPPRERFRCGCTAVPQPAPPEAIIRRPELHDNPGDALAALQEIHDRLRPLLDVVDHVSRDDLLSALDAVGRGGTKVYLATAQDTNSGDREVLGISTTHEGALAYLGSAWARDTGERINPRVDTLELDDPTGKVIPGDR